MAYGHPPVQLLPPPIVDEEDGRNDSTADSRAALVVMKPLALFRSAEMGPQNQSSPAGQHSRRTSSHMSHSLTHRPAVMGSYDPNPPAENTTCDASNIVRCLECIAWRQTCGASGDLARVLETHKHTHAHAHHTHTPSRNFSFPSHEPAGYDPRCDRCTKP